MIRASGFASVFALGVVLMLAASPASGAKCINQCTCATSCDQTCVDGICGSPQGCEVFTCGEWGRCIGSPGCSGSPTTCTSTINGGSSGDTLAGGSASESISGNGGGGNDSMYGSSGDDCLYGDAGADCSGGGPRAEAQDPA